MITLRNFAAIVIATSLISCSTVHADSSAKITLVNGKTIEAKISDRSNDATVYVVLSGVSTKVVRKIDRTQIAKIEKLDVAPLTSTVSKTGLTVAERALAAIRNPHVETIATTR
jgi:uncharacterized OsmC-like protein